MEVLKQHSFWLLNVLEYLGGNCNAVNGVSKLHQTDQEEALLLHFGEVLLTKELVDDGHRGALWLHCKGRRNEVLELVEPDKVSPHSIIEVKLLLVAFETASLLLNVLIIEHSNVHDCVKRLLIDLEKILLVKLKVKFRYSKHK